MNDWSCTERPHPTPALPASFQRKLEEELRTRAEEDEAVRFPGPPSERGPLGRLGPYHVLREVGRGGFGRVFAAYDERLDCLVALKVLRPELARRAEGRARFEREARQAASVRHENIVTVRHVGTEPGFPPYFVM